LSLIVGSYRATEPSPTTGASTPGVEPATSGSGVSVESKMAIWRGYFGISTTEVRVYDVADPASPSLVRNFEQDGNYLSSRRIGADVYLITNRYTWYDASVTVASMIPSVRNGSGTFATIAPSAIGIVKSNDYSSFLVVSGLDTVDTGKAVDTKALLGAGSVLYASSDYLYVAATRWVQQESTVTPASDMGTGSGSAGSSGTVAATTPEPPFYDSTNSYPSEDGQSKIVDFLKDKVVVRREIYMPDRLEVYVLDADGNLVLDPKQTQVYPTSGPQPTGDPTAPDQTVTTAPDPTGDATVSTGSKDVFTMMPMPVVDTVTDIFRFRISDATVTEAGVGSVPGYALNQFAMDESGGYFRIATTVGDAWRNDEYTSMNNLYVLDKNLKTVGKVEGLASRETIKSVRFIGDRAYLVTFQTTDPLFVVDLSKPTTPAVVGELKIPGYSEYLHPYSDTLLLGFGKDALVQGDMAYYLGMKFSMYDVSDPSSPKEITKLSLGDRGTDSEISYNQKALLFSKDKNLIGIPITINRVPQDQASDPIAYGQPVWQGFAVLGYDAAGGLYVRGLVTHSNKNVDFTQVFKSYEDINAKADPEALYGARTITRGLYVGDTLYTISGGMVKTTSLTDFSTLGTVELPGAADSYGQPKAID